MKTILAAKLKKGNAIVSVSGGENKVIGFIDKIKSVPGGRKHVRFVQMAGVTSLKEVTYNETDEVTIGTY